MSTGKVILLFILGMILALLTFPVAFAVSVGLGYVLAITAIILGAYLISKRGERTLPLVLGIVLAGLSCLALTGTAIIHMGVWALKETVKEVMETVKETIETRVICGVLGKPVKVGDWEITVLDVKESTYVREDDRYYKAREGYKAVIVTLRIKNLRNETARISDIDWEFMIISSANKSYEKLLYNVLELTRVFYITEDIKSKAILFRELDTNAPIAPGTYVEGDLLFEIPENEKPVKLHLRIGIVGGYEVAIELKTS